MENKSNTLILTFQPRVSGNQHTLQAFFDIVNSEGCECPVVISNAGKPMQIAKIFKVIKYNGKRQDLTDSVFTVYARVNANFLKRFRPINPNKEIAIRIELLPYTNLVSSICLEHWYDHFTSRNSA